MNWMRTRLTIRAWVELVLYDARIALGGFRSIQRSLKKQRVSAGHPGQTTGIVCTAVDLAACLYVKPVHCLQRSTVTVRMLRQNGIAASLAIAYRPAPFFAHAYVEVDGRIVNDSPAYAEQLTVLYRQTPVRKDNE